MILSPCIKVCVMDPARRVCVGCGRTLDEIARWGSMSDGERAETMKSLPSRLLGAPASSRHQDGLSSTAGKMPALPVE